MSTSLPTKSSSRSGRFKKKLVSLDFLIIEAPLIQNRMGPLTEILHQGRISAAEFTGLYLLTVLAHRFPGTWPGSRRNSPLVEDHSLTFDISSIKRSWEPNVQKRLEGLETLGDVFNHFAFKSTPLTVNRSILNWSRRHYGLELMFRIPTPEEVLDQQKQGRRCVTVILEKERASKFILGERDALGFTMHDLIHADHFYHNNHCYQGQLGFYGFLDHCLKQGHFAELLENPKFESEFEYLIADMNAYAIHLMKCFKSALIHYHPEGDQFYSDWLKKLELNEAEREALKDLNSPNYHGQQDEVLLNFLRRYEVATSHTDKA